MAKADLQPSDLLMLADLSASDNKRISTQDFAEKAVTLIADASIPSAKVNLSSLSASAFSNYSIPVTKLVTADIPVAGGLQVDASGHLVIKTPLAPLSLEAGQLKHATSSIDQTTYHAKVMVDGTGHVVSSSVLGGDDLPVPTATAKGGVIPGTGLDVTAAGVLNHLSGGTTTTKSGISYDAQGHITGSVQLASGDLPVATAGVPGAVSPGAGTAVDVTGALSIAAATSSTLGGVIVSGDFAVSSGTLSLPEQAGLAGNSYPKVTVTTKGIVTAGGGLLSTDIPNLDASKITTGTLAPGLYGTKSVSGAKLADYSTVLFGGAGSTSGVVSFPTAEFTGQGFLDAINNDYYLWDGNAWQPLSVLSGNLTYAGTYNATTNHVVTHTTAGDAAGIALGGALPAGTAALNGYYVVISVSGTGAAPAPVVAMAAPDMLVCNGATWDLVATSTTVAGVSSASGISFTPAGTVASVTVQAAIAELDNEKLAKSGDTVTGELLIGNTGVFGFEGSTANAYETYLSAVDPTADRAIVFPDASGTVALSGAIVNADINASAAIAYSKLALGTSIVNADINASAAISGTKIQAASTSNVGAVQLIDSSSSASTTTAPTANALKTVADSISTLMPKAGGAFTGDVTLNSQSDLKFADSDSSNWVALQAPATVAANLTFTLPAVDGAAGQALVTNGSGALGWATAGGMSATGGTMTGRLNFISYSETALTSTISGGTVTFNLDAASVFNVTLNSNITTVTITNAQASKASAFTIFFTGDGTTRTISWGAIKWAGGTAPSFSYTNGKVNIVTLMTNDGGTTWFGFDGGVNF